VVEAPLTAKVQVAHTTCEVSYCGIIRQYRTAFSSSNQLIDLEPINTDIAHTSTEIPDFPGKERIIDFTMILEN
jgi:hypothetical protein